MTSDRVLGGAEGSDSYVVYTPHDAGFVRTLANSLDNETTTERLVKQSR